MNLIRRGIKNAFRNVIRTISIVVILGISIGLALIMLVARQAVGQKINSVKGSIDNTVTVTPAGIMGFQGGGNLLTDSQINEVKSLPHIISVSESLSDELSSSETNLTSAITPGSFGQRLQQKFGSGGGGGFFVNNQSVNGSSTNGATPTFTIPISLTGTSSPSTTDTSNGGTLKLTSGSEINGTENKDVALVGTSLASKNNLKVGSTFTAYGTTITVVGIYDTGTTFTNSGIIMSLPTVQSLSSQSNDISSATLYVDSISNLSAVVSEVQNKLGSSIASVTSSEQQADNAVQPLDSVQTIALYSLIGAAVAGSLIVLLTMVMIVRERRREIGVIKAIGASNLRVILQFTVESITLTLLGAIIGLGIGVVGSGPVTRLLVNNSSSSPGGSAGPAGGTGIRFGGGGHGGFLSKTFGSGGTFSFNNIHAVVGWDILLYSLAVAILIAVIGSALAAGLIAKIRPAEVLRTE